MRPPASDGAASGPEDEGPVDLAGASGPAGGPPLPGPPPAPDDGNGGPSSPDGPTPGPRRARRLAVALLAAIVVVIAVVLAGAFRSDPVADAPVTTVAVGGQAVGMKGRAETEALLQGLPQHGLTLGDPNAPATIVQVADLKCPACQRHEIETQPAIIRDLVRTGRANLEMRVVNIIDPSAGTADGQVARRAALNYVGANTFWNFVHTLYFNQGDERQAWATERRLRQIATAAPGVDPARLEVRETPASRQLAAAADRFARRVKAPGTPAIYVRARGSKRWVAVPQANDVAAIAATVDAVARQAGIVTASVPIPTGKLGYVG